MAQINNIPPSTQVVMSVEDFDFVDVTLRNYLEGRYYEGCLPHEDIQPYIVEALDSMTPENKRFGFRLNEAHVLGLALSMVRTDYKYEYSEIRKEFGAEFASEYQNIKLVIEGHWWPVHQRNFEEVAKQAIAESRKDEE